MKNHRSQGKGSSRSLSKVTEPVFLKPTAGYGYNILTDMLRRPNARFYKQGKAYPYSSTRQDTRTQRKLLRQLKGL
jgi:hypothetical protein